MIKRLLVVALAALAACHEAPPAQLGDQRGAPGGSFDLQPLVMSLGGVLPITWAVSPGGGSVNANGVYTAPTCAALLAALPPATDLRHSGQISGVDAVTASWTGGSVQINVTTQEAVLGVEVSPASSPVEPGGTLQFIATVHYSCHDQTTGP